MNIVIFEDVTTDSALAEIEANAAKYKGLYVEMSNAPERKYVKGMASEISGLLKKLDRARIDKSKAYKQSVESEAEKIRLRLEEANEPFTILIDEYAKERAAILAKEKAARELIELRAQIEKDQEFALLMDAQFESEKLKKEQERMAYEENLKKQAAEDARIKAELESERAANLERDAAKAREDQLKYELECAEKAKLEAQQREIDAENKAKFELERKAEDERQQAIKREADTKHKASVNNLALSDFIAAGLNEKNAKLVVKAIASRMISGVSIQY